MNRYFSDEETQMANKQEKVPNFSSIQAIANFNYHKR